MHLLDTEQVAALNMGGGAGKARGAVMDKNVAVDPSHYRKKVVEKDASVRLMINEIIDTSILFR